MPSNAQNDKYTFRNIKPEDVEAVTKLANNLNVTRYMSMRFPNPFTHEDAERLIAFLTDKTADPGHYFQVIEVDNQLAGMIGVHFERGCLCKCSALSYWLGEPFWGRGIVQAAVEEMCEYVFSHFDIMLIYGEVFSPNTASMKILERAGFHLEAIRKNGLWKYGVYYDKHVYVRYRNDS